MGWGYLFGLGGEKPKWWSEFKWSDLFGGIKEDVVKGAKTLQSSTKTVLGGITSALTPTIIWLVVLLIIGLLIFSWFKKLVKV